MLPRSLPPFDPILLQEISPKDTHISLAKLFFPTNHDTTWYSNLKKLQLASKQSYLQIKGNSPTLPNHSSLVSLSLPHFDKPTGALYASANCQGPVPSFSPILTKVMARPCGPHHCQLSLPSPARVHRTVTRIRL